jgi:drug/metabolite transporter (DMT)-like permease
VSGWLILSIFSAVLLGLYDYFKKVALKENDVLPVLAGSVFASCVVWLPFMAISAVAPQWLPHAIFDVARLPPAHHGLLLGKALLVGASWVCGYMGISRLPLSIATPIRATGPLWTIGLAVLCFGEAPSGKQWLGLAVILGSFFAFTFVGRGEGIHFHRDKGVFLMLGATVLGALSALYDKFLLQTASIAPGAVQAWFTFYLGLLLLPVVVPWWRKKDRRPFRWHWAVPMIGLTLLAADLLYFIAISLPDAMISLISPVRRTSVIVSFLLGILLFREVQPLAKGLCVLGIVGGVLLLA